MDVKHKHNPFIIAEIGINHNGDLSIAKKLIDIAKSAGCDAVKFQKRDINVVYSAQELDMARESPWGTSQRQQKEGLEFGRDEYDEIDKYCRNIGILWSASAWDCGSQQFLQSYNLPFNKIASALITHRSLLEMVASEKKLTYISTGMSTTEMIESAVNIFKDKQCPFVLMHCVSVYPCDDDKVHLGMILELKQQFGVDVGYSGHERGISPTLVAVSLGAVAVERHITLDRTMYGSDQAASLEEVGLRRLVRDIRSIPEMLGSRNKKISVEEGEVAKKLRYWE